MTDTSAQTELFDRLKKWLETPIDERPTLTVPETRDFLAASWAVGYEDATVRPTEDNDALFQAITGKTILIVQDDAE